VNLEEAFNKSWYGKGIWTYLFYPLKPLVSYLVYRKRRHYLATQSKNKHFFVPIIVVGNITVGGTGKSPMVLALVKALKEAGYCPGIVSRGYGIDASEPLDVYSESLAKERGDEPVMLAKKAGCPVVICRDRVKAVSHLLKGSSVDVVISDDGMQHYTLERDVEILMLDAERGLGNGQLLPIGPLREPISRLQEVDFVATLVPQSQDQQIMPSKVLAINNKLIEGLLIVPLKADYIVNVQTGEKREIDFLKTQENWYVMAGIGNPERFLNTLQINGLTSYECHWFSDHHDFQLNDFPVDAHVIMTEKDAVKCRELATSNPNLWYLSVGIELPNTFKTRLFNKLEKIQQCINDNGEK